MPAHLQERQVAHHLVLLPPGPKQRQHLRQHMAGQRSSIREATAAACTKLWGYHMASHGSSLWGLPIFYCRSTRGVTAVAWAAQPPSAGYTNKHLRHNTHTHAQTHRHLRQSTHTHTLTGTCGRAVTHCVRPIASRPAAKTGQSSSSAQRLDKRAHRRRGASSITRPPSSLQAGAPSAGRQPSQNRPPAGNTEQGQACAWWVRGELAWWVRGELCMVGAW